MSDRKTVIDIRGTRPNSKERITLFMDGDTGTWRIFLEDAGELVPNVDLSLSCLLELQKKLARVIADINEKPDSFNAEIRAKWEDR